MHPVATRARHGGGSIREVNYTEGGGGWKWQNTSIEIPHKKNSHMAMSVTPGSA